MIMDIDQALNAFTMLGARWVLWLLFALSVAGVTVAVERAVLLWTSRDDVGRLQQELRRLLLLGDLERARRRLEESPSFEARIAAAGLQARGEGARRSAWPARASSPA
jgi:biopolymer transport protein ExbB